MWQDRGFLEDIERSCERIIEKSKGRTQDEFLESDDLHDIVTLHMAVIGESARKLSDDTKEKLDSIPWHKVIGMRNRIAHDYKSIDFDEIWNAATKEIPKLYKVVRRELGRQ